MSAVTAEVPFVIVGDRRALTDQQLMEDAGLSKFIERFRHSFERDDVRMCWWFVERD